MRLTKRQLRRIIRESIRLCEMAGPEEDAAFQEGFEDFRLSWKPKKWLAKLKMKPRPMGLGFANSYYNKGGNLQAEYENGWRAAERGYSEVSANDPELNARVKKFAGHTWEDVDWGYVQ